MSRYIDVDLKEAEIVDKIQEISAHPDVFIAVRKVLNLFPTADVEPVRHGHWIFQKSYYDADECICSRCSQHMTTHIKERMLYCPNCGAKMDEEVEE